MVTRVEHLRQRRSYCTKSFTVIALVLAGCLGHRQSARKATSLHLYVSLTCDPSVTIATSQWVSVQYCMPVSYSTRVTITNLHQPPTSWLENICVPVAPLQEKCWHKGAC